MKTLNKKLLVPVVLLLCIAFMMSCYIGNVNQIAFAEQAEDLQNQSQGKVYCNATIDDDFADDTVLVVLANDVSTQKANARTNFSAEISTEDFSEVGCVEVENLTSCSSAIVDEEVARLSNPISTLSAENEAEHKVNVNNFKRIISLKLSTPGKQNVLDAIKKLEKRKDVLAAQPNYFYFQNSVENVQPNSMTSNDPSNGKQWAINKIGLSEAWDKSTGNYSVKVGIIDTGVDANHEDLKANINRTLSKDFTGDTSVENPEFNDVYVHGTHVAGIIGAKGNNGIGVTGVCWKVQMISLRVHNGRVCQSSWIAKALDYAASKNLPLVNCSMGAYGTDTILSNAIQNFSGLLVCSAGNDIKNTDDELRNISSCNYMNNVISVGATDSNDKIWINGKKGSNFGAKTVDLFAPGANIYSTLPNNLYGAFDGTSMATPFVTGVAALLLSRYPNMSAGVIKANILEGVDKVAALDGLCVTGGRLNADFELKVLNTSIVSKSGNKWTIKLTNPTDSAVEVIYNSKMCTEADAKEWKNLVDIEVVALPAGTSRNVVITERLFATHIAFSYIDGDTRYVTYSNELNTDGTISSSFTKVKAYSYGPLSIIGKNGNTWKIKVFNFTQRDKTIQYNAKMCTLEDAKNWNGLQDIKSVFVEFYESAIIEITENSFAPAIAASFIASTVREIYYGTNLSPDTTMTYESDWRQLYLNLENVGKSGSAWLIKITNTTTSTFTIEYNSKMCTESDGKNWTGLADIKKITLKGGESVTVKISERLFATSITASYVFDGVRYVSYANSLNTSGGIKVMYYAVKA